MQMWYHNILNTEADMSVMLPALKPDKEISKNMKQCHSHHSEEEI